MSFTENEDPSLKKPEQQEQDPDTISDEEFEKQQKKDKTIIEVVVNAVTTFFQLFFS